MTATKNSCKFSFRKGHELMTIPKEGSIVDLVSDRRRALGVIFKGNKSKLRVRKVVSTDPLAELFFKKRNKLRLTCKDVEAVGAEQGATFTYHTVWRLEQGRPSPTPGVVEDIARALGFEIPKELIPKPKSVADLKLNPGITKLGKFLKEKRLSLKMTQLKFSEHLGVSHSMVNQIESGSYKPGKNAIEKISKALDEELPT